MSEERKTYSIIGKVEIGTDEYRDLIEAVKEAETEADRYRSDYWRERDKSQKFEKELAKLKEKYNTLLELTNTDAAAIEKYGLYRKIVESAGEK